VRLARVLINMGIYPPKNPINAWESSSGGLARIITADPDHMRRHLRALAVACATVAAALLVGPATAQVSTLEEPFSRVVPLSPDGSLTLSNPSGNISIKGMGDAVRIEAVKRVNGNDPRDSQSRLDAMKIEVTGGPNAVVVETTIPNQPGEPDAVDYTLTVPPTVSVTVKARNGDVQISNVSGVVEVSTIRGRLTMTELGNLRSATAIVGDIDVANSRGENVTLDALSGPVRVAALIASSLDLNVGDGNIACDDVRANRAYIRTEQGDIQYAGPLERGGLYQLHSTSGSVRMTPQGDVGFTLDASAFRGEIRSNYEFPPTA